MNPFKMARISSVMPMVQLSSRGLRKAPVKKIRAMWTTIGAEEDVGRPVVHLAHQQPAAHGEGQVDRRRVGLRHPYAVQRLVGAVVDDCGLRGHEVQGQEDPGGQQHHERVQGDLAQHERPVVREDLVEEGPAALGQPEAVVELVDGLLDPAVGAAGLLGLPLGAGLAAPRWCSSLSVPCGPLPEARADRLVVAGLGPEVPATVDVEGQLGQRAGGRAELRARRRHGR